jgi:hypothetical protein
MATAAAVTPRGTSAIHSSVPLKAFIDCACDGACVCLVEHSENYEPVWITLAKACGLVWNCTDVMPGIDFEHIVGSCDLDVKRQTYAAVARAMLANLKERASG